MQTELIFKQMLQNMTTIKSLIAGISREQAFWKPAASSWSLVEVINHLADEEVEDFRTRLDLTLHSPNNEWPPIAPEQWVRDRGYNSRDSWESLQRFCRAREESVAWLKALPDPDWETATRIPGRDPMVAGALLLCWLAHDWLHIRQLTRLHYEYLRVTSSPHDLSYAG
ncbi:MAG: DinB family protein [Candidatus Latescibacteria bacterium]|jgi:hypothetical protein|nr:DinB family protein [Candidatus Latescibacterota bacterium]